METTVVRINRVTIHSFKNIKNLTFTLFGGEDLVVEGKNGLGKSNIINAIYWCINGVDLNGCSDQSQFIPFKHPGLKADVEVVTSVGKIERIAETDSKGSVSQTIKLDDQVYSLKDYEVEIDKRMGLLPFTLSNFSNKDFKLREFLMNPAYHLRLTPKAIRDVLAKRYSFEMTHLVDFKKPLFNPLFIDLLKRNGLDAESILDFYDPIEKISISLDASKKELKKTLDECSIVRKYLDSLGGSDVTSSRLCYLEDETKTSMSLVDQDIMILDSGRQTWNECLEKYQSGLLMVRFQTTTSKGVKKNCFVIEESTPVYIELNQVSTSENTMDSIELADSYLKGIDCHVELPIFIDRAESINKEKFELLKGRQKLLTKVTSGRNIKINGSEVK